MIIKHYSFDPTFTVWYLQVFQHFPSEALLKVMRLHRDADISAPTQKLSIIKPNHGTRNRVARSLDAILSGYTFNTPLKPGK